MERRERKRTHDVNTLDAMTAFSGEVIRVDEVILQRNRRHHKEKVADNPTPELAELICGSDDVNGQTAKCCHEEHISGDEAVH